MAKTVENFSDDELEELLKSIKTHDLEVELQDRGIRTGDSDISDFDSDELREELQLRNQSEDYDIMNYFDTKYTKREINIFLERAQKIVAKEDAQLAYKLEDINRDFFKVDV